MGRFAASLRVDPRFESEPAQPITFFHAVNFAMIEARRVKDLANRISETLCDAANGHCRFPTDHIQHWRICRKSSWNTKDR
jgi:hypothetical protein